MNKRNEFDLSQAIEECECLTKEGICTVPYKDGKYGACAFANEEGAIVLAGGVDPIAVAFIQWRPIIVNRYPQGRGMLPKEARIKKVGKHRDCPRGFLP